MEGLWEYFVFVLSGVVMKMEWWVSEMTVVMAGYLLNFEIVFLVLFIYGSMNVFVFDVLIGFGVVLLMCVMYEFGVGNVKRARRVVVVLF